MHYKAKILLRQHQFQKGEKPMSRERFHELMGEIAKGIAGRSIKPGLAGYLNQKWPAEGEEFSELKRLCAEGEREGWLMAREAGGIRFGRAIKPGEDAGDFSVDVVRMKDVRGPHHVHPNGEIGAIMAIEGAPKFDGFGEGWYVYEAGSAHHPTVSGGEAYVLYLLPQGAIEFTGN
jgi:hypothetical protein